MRIGYAGWVAVVAAVALLAACGSGSPGGRVDGDGQSQGGSGGTGGGAGGSGGGEARAPEVTALERLGVHHIGPYRAALPARTGHLDVFGFEAVDVLPAEVGHPELPTNDEGRAVVDGGLAVLDRRNGTVRTYGSAEGVPEAPVLDGNGNPQGSAAMSVFDLAWLEPDASFVGATGEGILRGRMAGDGSIEFALGRIPAPAGEGTSAVFTVDVAGGEILAGTADGLAVLDASTLEVVRWADVGTDEGSAAIWRVLAADLDGAPVVAAIVGTLARPGHVAVIDGPASQLLSFDGLPISVAAIPGGLVVGVLEPDGRGSLQTIRRGPDGLFVEPLVTADELFSASAAAIVPGAMVYDPVRKELHLGARFLAPAIDLPPGLYRIALDAPILPLVVQDVVDTREPEARLVPRGVLDLELDAAGGLYVVGLDGGPDGAREAGLLRWEFARGGEPRVYRPILSGVAAIAVDANGDTWVGMRDELADLTGAPFNYNFMSGACRLLADARCQVFAPRINTPPDFTDDGWQLTAFHVRADPLAADFAFGAAAQHEFAILGLRDRLYVRRHDLTRGIDSAGFHVGRWASRAIWGAEGELWIASPMEWSGDCPGDACQDHTPHGLVHLRLGDDDRVVEARRFVRRAAPTGFDIGGFPSNTAHAVLPLAGQGHALVALGRERQIRQLLRDLPALSPDGIEGGIVEVEGTEFRSIAPPEGLAFGDVVDLARAADGRILAVDADLGLFEVDLEARTARRWAEPAWPGEARPLSLAIDATGRIAVGTSAGLWVYGPDGAATRAAGPEHGFVWRVSFLADGVLYAGCDEGLVRIALDGAALPPTGRRDPLPREPWDLPPGCGGGVDCWCDGDDDCEGSLVCECNESWTDCGCRLPEVDCGGQQGCPCTDASECVGASPECLCFEGDGCFCYGDLSACGGGAGCLCTEQTPCAEGFECTAGWCSAPPPCQWDCSCETENGCPEGWIKNQTEEDPATCSCSLPPGCGDDCSCPTETGCPPNKTCVDMEGTRTCFRDGRL